MLQLSDCRRIHDPDRTWIGAVMSHLKKRESLELIYNAIVLVNHNINHTGYGDFHAHNTREMFDTFYMHVTNRKRNFAKQLWSTLDFFWIPVYVYIKCVSASVLCNDS
ncbi:hypothetical protein Sjap_010711 [Stephania japonica]|uniref:Uncharacterized protein n=1 Tax=Stephania japonica TaxID=461633 RepID=A0AAP0P4U1_9MAGN